jgi:hypothetical protein
LHFNFFKPFEGVRGLFWPQSCMYAGQTVFFLVHMWVVLGQPAYMQGLSFWESVPPQKQKEMHKEGIEMQEGYICTYLVRAEVRFVL